MIRPGYLRKGDTIGIAAPAGSLLQKEIEQAVDIFRSWGLTIEPGKHIFRKKGSFAGTDDQRAGDMQKMLNDTRLKAIVCARGGYGTIRIANRLNFDSFVKNPKWIVGYSDITVLHSALHKLAIESIHGAMPRIAEPKKLNLVSFDSLRSLLFGEVSRYRIRTNSVNRSGVGKGELTGGNLSVLYSLNGTRFDIDTRDKILFIEDIGEYLYHLDRMMMNLKLSGKLDRLAGLIVGEMTDMKATTAGFRKSAYQVIREAVAEFDFPVIYGFPAGHGDVNLALPMGRVVTMEVSDRECDVRFG